MIHEASQNKPKIFEDVLYKKNGSLSYIFPVMELINFWHSYSWSAYEQFLIKKFHVIV